MNKTYLIFILLLFVNFYCFFACLKTYKSDFQLAKMLDTLSKHPVVCDFSAKVDCSHPWGTQFLGFVYSQWFGNELNKECYESSKRKKISFSLAHFEGNFDYKYIPKEVLEASSLNKKIIDTTYANTHKISQEKLSALPNDAYYRNVIMLQPISHDVVYAEFKVSSQNKYFPITIVFYVVFDKNNNIKKIFQYTEYPRPS
jgi:hypothetical protein